MQQSPESDFIHVWAYENLAEILTIGTGSSVCSSQSLARLWVDEPHQCDLLQQQRILPTGNSLELMHTYWVRKEAAYFSMEAPALAREQENYAYVDGN